MGGGEGRRGGGGLSCAAAYRPVIDAKGAEQVGAAVAKELYTENGIDHAHQHYLRRGAARALGIKAAAGKTAELQTTTPL